MLYSVEEQCMSGDSASFRPSSSVLDYSHPCLTELAGNINYTEFITEATSKNIIIYVWDMRACRLIKLYIIILLHPTYHIIITLYRSCLGLGTIIYILSVDWDLLTLRI